MTGDAVDGPIRLPGGFAARVRDIEAGAVEPVPTRDASTVILLRPDMAGYMLRRVRSMAFAPGAYVFPGGSADPRDADHAIGWAGPAPEEWGAALGADLATARQLVCAAVRETFEESGVLLAGPSGDTVVEDTTGEEWEADRHALLDRSLSLAEMLDRRGLVLRADLLRPWGHWITPVIEPRRYNTRFFVAALPPGQRTRDVSTESDAVTWVRPATAVDAARSGRMAMLPPTLVTLSELAPYETVADVLAARRVIAPRLPEVRLRDGAAFLHYPD
jgi:8-oxo-dGTP pyrophosphatase MutT (NUDIX family)